MRGQADHAVEHPAIPQADVPVPGRGRRRAEPPVTRDNLTASNAGRQARAGIANAERARQALDILGDTCPAHWRHVAELRIANPRASWAELAIRERTSRDALSGHFRRLLDAAGLRGRS